MSDYPVIILLKINFIINVGKEGIMKPDVKRLLQKAVNWKVSQKLFSWVLARAPRLIPLTPLRESAGWIVFVHPSPAYPVHLVVLPKKPIRNWMALSVDDGQLFGEFIQLTQAMIRDFELEPAGYRLILNGGPNQTFPHMHFHLIAGDPLPENGEESK